MFYHQWTSSEVHCYHITWPVAKFDLLTFTLKSSIKIYKRGLEKYNYAAWFAAWQHWGVSIIHQLAQWRPPGSHKGILNSNLPSGKSMDLAQKSCISSTLRNTIDLDNKIKIKLCGLIIVHNLVTCICGSWGLSEILSVVDFTNPHFFISLSATICYYAWFPHIHHAQKCHSKPAETS